MCSLTNCNGLALETGTVQYVPLSVGRRLIVAEHRRHAVALVREVVDARIDKAVELVEAALQRQKPPQLPAVPFAEHGRRIAGLLEHLGNHDLPRVHPQHRAPG